jgi:hypothetical protein
MMATVADDLMKTTAKSFRAVGALAVTLVFGFGGCKTSDRPLTQSGFPEVALSVGTPANQVKSVAQEFFSNRGYVEIESRHAYEFVFDKPAQSGQSSKALRVRLRLHQQTDGSWRLVGAPMGVEAWRSDLETERVLPQGASQIQAFLIEIKSRVESGR